MLGRYRLVRRLGAGGMAEVFLARSAGAEGIEKLLVLKRVLPNFARSQKFKTMFINEAKVAMRLNHPNIVQVYAFEQVKEEFLLAMEFVDGQDLGRLQSDARRSGARISFGLAAYIVAEVAKGLDYAHNRKDEEGSALDIVHRDVSPQNVLLSYEGSVKVADFGIARARMVSEDTGVIKGKFSYMSPEQARGAKVDRRSDVYALGVLFAELLMERPMYPDHVGLEILELVRKGVRTLAREVNSEVPHALDEIVRKATEYDPEARYGSARELAGALAQWLHAQPQVFDAAVLEQFITEASPRHGTSSDAAPPSETLGTTALTKESAKSRSPQSKEREFRERRHVVVISARMHGESDDATAPGISKEADRVLRELAYKNDAAFFLSGDARRSFRLLLGLGRATVHEPLRACRVAFDVLDALSGLSADLEVPLRASVGISRGIVSTLRSADGRLRKYEPVGAVVDVADKLAAACSAGEIFSAGEVYRAARRDYAFDDHDAREVTFMSQQGPRAIRAYRLLRSRTREERARDAQAGTGPKSLIGRENELREIREAYQETVQARRSSFMAIVGELGVGKTALVTEALKNLSPSPRILRADCAFGAGEVAYASLADLMRDACDIPPDADLETAAERLTECLLDLVPDPNLRDEMRLGLEPLVVPEKRDRDGSIVHDDSQRMISAVRNLIGALAARGPVVLCMDSLQWADGPSLSVLSAIARRSFSSAMEAPIFSLLVTRPDSTLDAVLQSVPRMDLTELDAPSRLALIRARFEGANVPGDIEQAVVERAGGNPYFICELVEALQERGIVHVEGDGNARVVIRRPGPIALPTTLEGTIAARLAELPDEERLVVRWLSAAGPGMHAVDLSDLIGRDVSAALSTLEQRHLVEIRPGGTYAFTSAVVRHIAYESSEPDDRRQMHKRLAAHLSGLSVAAAPARIARHLERAGDRNGAASAYLLAARAAQGTDSTTYALRLYAKVLTLLAPDNPERFRVHEARESLLRAAGLRHERRVELETMRALAERLSDPAMRAWSFNYLARYELDESRSAGVDALLKRALGAAIEAGESAAEVEALRLSAHLARDLGDLDKAIDACDRALVRAGVHASTLPARGDVLAQRGQLLRRVGRLGEACEDGAESIVIFRRLGKKRDEAQSLLALSISLASLGSFEDAIALTRASVDLDRETGARVGVAHKLSVIGQLYTELGDYARSSAFLERSLEVYEAIDDADGLADALTGLARVYVETNRDVDEATSLLDRAYSVAVGHDSHYDLAQERIERARLHLKRGQFEEAFTFAADGVQESQASGVAMHQALATALLAWALAELGRVEEAAARAADAQRLLGNTTQIERAEDIFDALLGAFRIVDREEAIAVARESRAVVDHRLRQIRDRELRECYLRSPMVREITEANE